RMVDGDERHTPIETDAQAAIIVLGHGRRPPSRQALPSGVVRGNARFASGASADSGAARIARPSWRTSWPALTHGLGSQRALLRHPHVVVEPLPGVRERR